MNLRDSRAVAARAATRSVAVEVGRRPRLASGVVRGGRRRAAAPVGRRRRRARRAPARATTRSNRARARTRARCRRRPAALLGAMSTRPRRSPPNTASTPIHVVARRRSPWPPTRPTTAPAAMREQPAEEHALVAAEHDRADDRLERADRDERRGGAVEPAPVEHGADAEEHEPDDERDRGASSRWCRRRSRATCCRSTPEVVLDDCSRSRSGTGRRCRCRCRRPRTSTSSRRTAARRRGRSRGPSSTPEVEHEVRRRGSAGRRRGFAATDVAVAEEREDPDERDGSTSAVTHAARIGPGTTKPAASATTASPAVNTTPGAVGSSVVDLDDERHDADDHERARGRAEHVREPRRGRRSARQPSRARVRAAPVPRRRVLSRWSGSAGSSADQAVGRLAAVPSHPSRPRVRRAARPPPSPSGTPPTSEARREQPRKMPILPTDPICDVDAAVARTDDDLDEHEEEGDAPPRRGGRRPSRRCRGARAARRRPSSRRSRRRRARRR